MSRYKTPRVGFCFLLTPARHTERSVHYQCMSFRLCAIVFFYFVGVSLFITMPNHTIVEYLISIHVLWFIKTMFLILKIM